MNTTGLLLLTLACLAAVTTTAAKGGRRGSQGGGKFRALKECCPTFPLVVKEESIKTCVAAKKASRAQTTEGPAGDAEETGSEATPGAGKGKKGKRRGDKGSRGCMMECVFKADGFTTTNAEGKEELNLKALNNQLNTLATGEWEPIIKEAQNNCTSTVPSPKPGQTCSSGANTVAKCLFKYMLTKCPSPVSSTTCTERLAKISQWGKSGRNGGKGRNRKNEVEVDVQGNNGKKDDLDDIVQGEGAA